MQEQELALALPLLALLAALGCLWFARRRRAALCRQVRQSQQALLLADADGRLLAISPHAPASAREGGPLSNCGFSAHDLTLLLDPAHPGHRDGLLAAHAELLAFPLPCAMPGLLLLRVQMQHAGHAPGDELASWRLALQEARLGLLEFDLDARTVQGSPQALHALLGLPADAERLAFSHWLELLHPEDRSLFSALLKHPEQRQESASGMEFRVRHPHGHWEWLEQRTQFRKDEQGRISHIHALCQIVTARKSAEAAMLRREQEFRTLVENSEDVIARYDLELRCQFINRSVGRYSALTREEHLGRGVHDKDWPDSARANFAEECAKLLTSGEARRFELELSLTARRVIFEVRLFPEFDLSGGLRSILAVEREITHSRQSERLLAEENAVMEMIAGNAPLQDALNQVCRMMESQLNRGACSIMLLNAAGDTLRLAAGQSLPPGYRQLLEQVPVGPEAGSCGTAVHRKSLVIVEDIALSPLWAGYREQIAPFGLQACWSTPIFSSDRRLLGAFAIYHPEPHLPEPEELQLAQRSTHLIAIALQRDAHEKKLYQLATLDELTGLCNRRQFIALAGREIERNRRYQLSLAVLMMDLDHFKSINDRHGHAKGDEVIVHFAQSCRNVLRSTDICGRLGGEEFAAVLPDTKMEDALLAAERLRRAVAEARLPGGEAGPLQYTVSIGVAVLRADESDIDEVLIRADRQLYQAKHSGRNCISGEELLLLR
ncbi:diguanylate cyclase [Chromobacterium aquaticum]|uniref:diguanylate cyclase n=1 Tax=Chromobacterium aquaticum TaxID=467180 RepID=A0ABV8ZQQ6_9NEIS|nr:diguanylate cyclase [Chromobacterium aquaticum]MCD5361278.1 diguanylate cyclase [Chromobacterium aquaticum]